MYLTAQRVVSTTGGGTGINTFLYSHPDIELVDSIPEPPSDDSARKLVRKHTPLPPGHNRVASYLDVVAPDSITDEEIENSFFTFLRQHEGHELPWAGRAGRCRFSFNLDVVLSGAWRNEILELLGEALSLHGGSRRDVEER